MMPIAQAHSNPDNLPKNLGFLRVSKDTHRNGRQGMRLQDDGVTLDGAPATGKSVAHFHEVNRTLEFRTPYSFSYLVPGFVDLHETARRKKGIHGEIFRPNVPIRVSVICKQLEISHGNSAPLLDYTPQVRRFLQGESWIEPGRYPHLSYVARSAGQVRLLRMSETN